VWSQGCWTCLGGFPADKRCSWWPVLPGKNGMEAAQGPSARGPRAAGLVLGFYPLAGAVHCGLFFLKKMAWRQLRARQRRDPRSGSFGRAVGHFSPVLRTFGAQHILSPETAVKRHRGWTDSCCWLCDTLRRSLGNATAMSASVSKHFDALLFWLLVHCSFILLFNLIVWEGKKRSICFAIIYAI